MIELLMGKRPDFALPLPDKMAELAMRLWELGDHQLAVSAARACRTLAPRGGAPDLTLLGAQPQLIAAADGKTLPRREELDSLLGHSWPSITCGDGHGAVKIGAQIRVCHDKVTTAKR